MIIYVDIDETICETPEDRNYVMAVPILENIEKINALYDTGHTIVYWTARGSGTGKDWAGLTGAQLRAWGAKHHDLKLGKPVYDIFIDDKNYNADLFFKASTEQLVAALDQNDFEPVEITEPDEVINPEEVDYRDWRDGVVVGHLSPEDLEGYIPKEERVGSPWYVPPEEREKKKTESNEEVKEPSSLSVVNVKGNVVKFPEHPSKDVKKEEE